MPIEYLLFLLRLLWRRSKSKSVKVVEQILADDIRRLPVSFVKLPMPPGR